MRLTFEDCVLDVARRELWRDSEPVAVEPQVFDLLIYLVQNPDHVVTKEELLQAVWDGRIVTDSAITNRINAARRAIGDTGKAQRLIRTVPRKGFHFIGVIKELDAEPANAAVPRAPSSPPRNCRRVIRRRCVGIAGCRDHRVFALAGRGPFIVAGGSIRSRGSAHRSVGQRSPPDLGATANRSGQSCRSAEPLAGARRHRS